MKHLEPVRNAEPVMQSWDHPEAKLAASGIEEDEFALAYKKGFQMSLHFIKSLGANREMAEEVAQAAWVRGWQYRRQLVDSRLVVAWVNTIAKNLFLSMIVMDRRFDELVEAAAPCTLLRTMEAGIMMKECTEFESKMLTMYYLEGYTAAEIARMENLCATSVRVRLMRIRRSLRQKMMVPRLTQLNAQAA